jgi:hypothetical protein
MRRVLAAVAMSVLLLSGCTSGGDDTSAGATPVASGSGAAEPLLARFGLAGKSVVDVIGQLDQLDLPKRPADLKASVRPNELIVSSGDQKYSLTVPADQFYLSVAPYVDHTHDCFYHSLTTCKGELGGAQVQVRIVDSNNKVLIDEPRTTYANGFVGFWLPRNIEGTLQIGYAGKAAESRFSTNAEAPTCLTNLKLT